VFTDLDRALEWCEDRLLGSETPSHDAPPLPLAAYAICRGLCGQALARFESLLTYRLVPRGQRIVTAGEAADRIFLLARGEVSVTIDLASGERTRLSTLVPGMCFGELAIVNRSARTADVRADSDVECWELSVEAFDRMGETDPALKAVLVENLLRSTSELAGRLTIETSALSRYVEPEALGSFRGVPRTRL
jgi:CRP-like cAMP-binding protein